MDDRELRKAAYPLPTNPKALERFMCETLRLGWLTLVEVTSSGIKIERHVHEGEPALPASLSGLLQGTEPLDPDLPFLLQHVVVEQMPFNPERHILHTLIELFEVLKRRQLNIVALYVAAGDELAAALGLATGTDIPRLFGVPIYYVAEGIDPGHLLAVGSPTPFIVDATTGVVADLGGES